MTTRQRGRLLWMAAAGALILVVSIGAAVAGRRASGRADGYRQRLRGHFDHAAVITATFDSPQAVTRECLRCHPDATAVMKTPHWLWLGDEVAIPGRDARLRIGKRNLLNNFCIATRGNERSCTKCHAGYGWRDESFDFSRADNIDCLVCHEHSGSYDKGPYGMPTSTSDLAAAARSVGTPARENCLGCHAYGGGGQGVKHGDIDSSLAHAAEDEDVHMGRVGLACIDCHETRDHAIAGRAFSVSVDGAHGVACEGCHARFAHADARIDAHLGAVACQTCHIPSYATRLPTKAWWDWSKAGDASRADDPHEYLRIKGEFTYEQDARPEYRWFNRSTERYLLGDRIDPDEVTPLNRPRGDIGDPKARIWPFKVHRALQPIDAEHRYLLAPITGGEGGYWTTFDWDRSFRLGAITSKLEYSGRYGFARTEMYWPLSHMVVPKERALGCTDCHGAGGRMDWEALGYGGDPVQIGGRR